jgi:hypothetical protein
MHENEHNLFEALPASFWVGQRGILENPNFAATLKSLLP